MTAERRGEVTEETEGGEAEMAKGNCGSSLSWGNRLAASSIKVRRVRREKRKWGLMIFSRFGYEVRERIK
jgi:hypothetical protein